MLVRYFICIGAVALISASFAATARRVTLDWGPQTWNGGLTRSFDIDGSPSAPGNDVTMTIEGSTAELANDSITSLPTPQVNANLEGGQNPAQPSLNLAIDLSRKDRSVSVTIDFAAHYTLGVENVSFTIFGIDQAAGGSNIYIDEIRSIVGTLTNGTKIGPTISGIGSAVSYSGGVFTGNANVSATGAGSGNGNATISFNTTGLRSITLVFGAGGNAAVNPTFQDISFSDITFSPVPEINPEHAVAALCLVAVAIRRRGRVRRATS